MVPYLYSFRIRRLAGWTGGPLSRCRPSIPRRGEDEEPNTGVECRVGLQAKAADEQHRRTERGEGQGSEATMLSCLPSEHG